MWLSVNDSGCGLETPAEGQLQNIRGHLVGELQDSTSDDGPHRDLVDPGYVFSTLWQACCQASRPRTFEGSLLRGSTNVVRFGTELVPAVDDDVSIVRVKQHHQSSAPPHPSSVPKAHHLHLVGKITVLGIEGDLQDDWPASIVRSLSCTSDRSLLPSASKGDGCTETPQRQTRVVKKVPRLGVVGRSAALKATTVRNTSPVLLIFRCNVEQEVGRRGRKPTERAIQRPFEEASVSLVAKAAHALEQSLPRPPRWENHSTPPEPRSMSSGSPIGLPTSRLTRAGTGRARLSKTAKVIFANADRRAPWLMASDSTFESSMEFFASASSYTPGWGLWVYAGRRTGRHVGPC